MPTTQQEMVARIRELEVLVQSLNLEKEEIVKDKADTAEKLRLQVNNIYDTFYFISPWDSTVRK